jgi:hypothetical protein
MGPVKARVLSASRRIGPEVAIKAIRTMKRSRKTTLTLALTTALTLIAVAAHAAGNLPANPVPQGGFAAVVPLVLAMGIVFNRRQPRSI